WRQAAKQYSRRGSSRPAAAPCSATTTAATTTAAAAAAANAPTADYRCFEPAGEEKEHSATPATSAAKIKNLHLLQTQTKAARTWRPCLQFSVYVLLSSIAPCSMRSWQSMQ